jgi:imidazolonepropionase-like amidohydrolase
LLASLASALILGLASISQAQNPDLLLQRVTVIDSTGAEPHKAVDVLIRGNRIKKIASHVVPPRGARVVPADGKFLIPGLWDMHVHIWDADLAFPLFLANGVTGVRNMGGHPEDLKRWREELRDEKRVGPRLIACGPVVDGPPPIHADHSVVVEMAADARAAIDKLQSDVWDFIKVYDNVPRAAYLGLADEAKKKQIPFVGHVPLSVTALEASDAGQKSIEHLDGLDYVISPRGDGFRQARLERIGKPAEPGAMMKIPMRIADEINQLADTYDEKRATALFARLKQNGTWQVPTLSVPHAYASIGDAAFYGDPRLRYVDAQTRDGWEHNPIVHIDIPAYVEARKRAFQMEVRITHAAHEAGVRFLAGTDSGGVPYLYYGSSLHDELALLVDAGFTPLQALQAATRDAAEFLGLGDTGTVETGKRADLVLLRADPLTDIHNLRKIDAVILGGRLLGRDDLDGLLKTAEQKAK